jgi:hypothetical protein
MKRGRRIPFFARILAVVIALLWAAPSALRAQTLYVADFDTSKISAFNATTGNAISTFSSPGGLNYPTGLAIWGDILYIGNDGSNPNTVEAYDLDTGTPLPGFSTITGVNDPVALAVSGTGLYVVSLGSNTITEYNTATGAKSATFSNPPGLSEPTGIAISGTDIYVTNEGSNTVSEYSAFNGAPVTGFVSPTGLSIPEAIAVSGTDMYIAQDADGHNSVNEYNTTNGSLISAFVSPSVDEPADLLISGTDLYISNTGDDTVGEYSLLTGAPADGFSTITSVLGPEGLALEAQPIPEPATWTVFAVGIALLEGMRRFRRCAGSGPRVGRTGVQRIASPGWAVLKHNRVIFAVGIKSDATLGRVWR